MHGSMNIKFIGNQRLIFNGIHVSCMKTSSVANIIVGGVSKIWNGKLHLPS